MHNHRRRRFVLAAIAIWAITIPLLSLIVPVQPRLTIRTAAVSSVIGTTSDSRTMYTACFDIDDDGRSDYPSGTVQSWDLVTGRERGQFQLPKNEPPPSQPMNEQAADGGREKTLPLATFLLAGGGQALAYDYSGFGDGISLRIRSLTLQREVLRFDGCGVGSCTFSPDGKWLFVSHDITSRKVGIFDSATGRETLLDSEQPILQVSSCEFSPDSRLFAMMAYNGKRWHTHVWELEPLRLVRRVEGTAFDPTFSPNGRLLAGAIAHGKVRLVDLDTGLTRRILEEHEGMISAVAFAPDGRTLTAIDDFGGNARVFNRATTWDAATGRMLRSFVPPLDSRLCFDPNYGTFRKTSDDQDVVRMPRIVVQADDSVWRVFDTLEGMQITAVPEDAWPVRVSPDNRILVTHEQDDFWQPVARDNWSHWFRDHVPGLKQLWPERRRLQLWNLTNGQLLAAVDSEAAYYRFTPDSKTLITSNKSDRIDIWDVPPGMPITTILAWSLPLPMLVLLVGELRFRGRRKKTVATAGAA